MFEWIDAYRSTKDHKESLKIIPYSDWWRSLQTEINYVQSLDLGDLKHKNRLENLSGLLLFSSGLPNSTMPYVLENSVKIGTVQYPQITKESFITFISTN